MLLLSLIGCTATPAIEQPKADVPEFSQDEVIAIVKQYLLEHWIARGLERRLDISFASCNYVGNGKWSGAYSFEETFFFSKSVEYESGRWNFYEKSQTVEILP